ncbi:C40 family peptidase [Ornithinimicrobium cavernae]|uniref:C40 family peptidase n=1 Tax=Ornithinimicrobium cavernae TaxID=2666047 RepID=UPI0013795298|nr:C40 family peptidase [Ornithinimicrobium cavernae]
MVPPANNQGAEAAIAWAQANLGLPYSWGSSSGGAYDCSGFTTAAFRAAGISIPHQSEAQYHATSRVSLSDIQRGDLLFYSNNGTPSGIFHVAIYLGDGQVIHSLRDWSGWDGSKINGIHYASGLMGAGRP